MADDTSYHEWLKKDLGTLIEALSLSDLQRHFLRSRWLDQVLWMEGRANKARNLYYCLRLITIIGGVIVPTLVSLKVSDETTSTVIHGVTVVLSLLVAVSAAVEEFFHYGERWRHYRRTVEELKTEGWQFFQLSGPFRRYQDHDRAFPVFAARTEAVIQRDVEVYITRVVQEKEEEKEKPEQS